MVTATAVGGAQAFGLGSFDAKASDSDAVIAATATGGACLIIILVTISCIFKRRESFYVTS